MDNFISISGVSDRNQLKRIKRIFSEESIRVTLAIGYQVSNKMINQGTKNLRQPRFMDLGDLTRATLDHGFIPAIHYYTKDNKTITGDLEIIAEKIRFTDSTLVQFNTLPPSPEDLRKVKEMGFGIILIVAVSNKQSSQGGYAVWKGDSTQDIENRNPTFLVNQAYDRSDLIDYVMFDPSHGTNLELDLSKNSLAVNFGKEILARKDLDHVGLVYAGGINPGNVGRLTSDLNFFFPDRISIDAESGVRTNNQLNSSLVRDYLVNYKEALNEN